MHPKGHSMKVRRNGRPPSPESAIGRVRAFFETNPDEELTVADMQTKFAITDRRAFRIITELAEEGAVECRPSVRLVRGVAKA